MNNPPDPVPASGKSSSGFFLVLQLVCVVALAAWAVLLKRDLGVAEQELAKLRQRPAAPSVDLTKENQSLRARVATLEADLAVATSLAAKAPSAPVVPPPAPANALAALASNPAMRNIMAATQKRMMETRFADLFTQMQFTPEQRARFLEIMNEASAPFMEAGLKLAAGNMSAAEQAAMRQQSKDADVAVDVRLREFFGDESKFAFYKQFTEQQTERTQVNSLNATLAQSGQAPLTAGQAAALTNLMYAERKSFHYTPAPTVDPANPLAAATSPEATALRLQDQQRLQEQIAVRAATVLNPDQLAALRRDQATRMESQKASAEMAKAFLNVAQPPPR
jgi:hypothetical protein